MSSTALFAGMVMIVVGVLGVIVVRWVTVRRSLGGPDRSRRAWRVAMVLSLVTVVVGVVLFVCFVVGMLTMEPGVWA